VSEVNIEFACFDMRLNKAAQVLGLQAVFLGLENSF
jgi:hypothetical protein